MDAVNQNGEAIEFASEYPQRDRYIVMASVKQYEMALEIVS